MVEDDGRAFLEQLRILGEVREHPGLEQLRHDLGELLERRQMWPRDRDSACRVLSHPMLSYP